MNEQESRHPGAPLGNRNAIKPDDQKITGKGRVIVDFGPLKVQCVRAANARGMKLADWLREAAEAHLAK